MYSGWAKIDETAEVVTSIGLRSRIFLLQEYLLRFISVRIDKPTKYMNENICTINFAIKKGVDLTAEGFYHVLDLFSK